MSLSPAINYLALLIFMAMMQLYAGQEFFAGLVIGIYIGVEIIKWRWTRESK